MAEKTELTVHIDNLPREGKNIRVVMTNSRTLREHAGGGRIHGPSLVFSDIEKERGDRHYFEIVILDGADQVVDKAYINADLPQKKNIISMSLAGGIWRLEREINIGGNAYDRFVIDPLDEKRGASTRGTHSFRLVNSKTGDKTATGVFYHYVTDRESSLYGVEGIELVKGADTPQDMLICNENLFNLDLQAGAVIDAELRKAIFTDRPYPYTVAKNRDRVEFGLWIAQSIPKRANVIQASDIREFKKRLDDLSSSLAYRNSLPRIEDGKMILLRDVPVLHFRKQCIGQYKVFPYRYSTVILISALYDIAIQKVRAIKLA
ncbi:MAG: hypothetical protein M1508_07925 [Nitrospirae bacterium]|nr:hypothetical protein [Nitrospirota bacterium]MCL5422513.1 hypothetical protein [Nitrospirota bacterium]